MKAIQIFQICDSDKHKYLRLFYLHYSQRMPYYVLVRKKFTLKELYLKAVISENNVQCNSLISCNECCSIRINLADELKKGKLTFHCYIYKKISSIKSAFSLGSVFFNVLLKYVLRIIRLCCIIPQRLISSYVFVTYQSLYLYLQSL